MGVVYRAEDTHLDRSVAIKVLPADADSDPGRKRRFVQEAKSASALNHPNIVHIYDVGAEDGTDFIAMELVRGRTLDQAIGHRGLAVREAVRCTAQIARALAAAHAAGIVHRDLKPANVMLAEQGLVKVLDFGLAKLTESPLRGESSATRSAANATEPGAIVGTVSYMSPEQAEGKQVDARSDIFSFGALLYEVVTGRRAFDGGSVAGTLSAILHQEPRPDSSIPVEVEKIISRCLRKDPGRRPQHMGDVALALEELADSDAPPDVAGSTPPGPRSPDVTSRRTRRRLWISGGVLVAGAACLTAIWIVLGAGDRGRGKVGLAPIRTIAVLPFENLSGDPDQEYFVDGMTDAVTTELGKVSGFEKVSAWQSMRLYKKTTKSLSDIARELKVEGLVQGVVQREGHRVRISPKLFRVNPEKQLWADSYDRDLQEVLSLQSEVARAIAREVRVSSIAVEAPAGHPPSVNPEAYDYYLKGNQSLEVRMQEASERLAVRMYERAVALDPGFYQAHARLAYTHALLWLNYYDRSESRLAAARDAAGRAMTLRPESAEAHLAMGWVHYYGYLDYDRALAEFAFAQRANPNDSGVESAIAAVNRRQGRFEDAALHFERATSLNPNAGANFFDLAVTYALLRRYQEADAQFHRAFSLNASGQGQYSARRAWFALVAGKPDTARATLLEAREKKYWYQLIPYYWYELELWTGDYQAALSTLSSDRAEVFEWQWFYVPKDLLRAEALSLMGKPEPARRAYDAARKLLEDRLRSQPDDDRYCGSLGVAYAGLGRRKEALAAGKKGVDLCPSSKEAWRATFRRMDLARIDVMTGEFDDAVKQLDYLLSVPSRSPLMRC